MSRSFLVIHETLLLRTNKLLILTPPTQAYLLQIAQYDRHL